MIKLVQRKLLRMVTFWLNIPCLPRNYSPVLFTFKSWSELSSESFFPSKPLANQIDDSSTPVILFLCAIPHPISFFKWLSDLRPIVLTSTEPPFPPIHSIFIYVNIVLLLSYENRNCRLFRSIKLDFVVSSGPSGPVCNGHRLIFKILTISNEKPSRNHRMSIGNIQTNPGYWITRHRYLPIPFRD